MAQSITTGLITESSESLSHLENAALGALGRIFRDGCIHEQEKAVAFLLRFHAEMAGRAEEDEGQTVDEDEASAPVEPFVYC